MRCTDVGGTSKLANQVQRPNLVRLSKATLASTRYASPAVSRTRFASFEPGQRISRPLPRSNTGLEPNAGLDQAFLVRELLRSVSRERRATRAPRGRASTTSRPRP